MEFFMRAVNNQCESIVQKTSEIRHLLRAVLDFRRRSPEFAFMTSSVDLAAARAAYLVLKADLVALSNALYEQPADIPDLPPEEP
jgi:hypothetical protein